MIGIVGWTFAGLGLLALAAIILTSGDMWDRTAGTGDRRITRRGQLAAQRDRIQALERQVADCPQCTPPEFPDAAQLAVADATDPAPRFNQAAPAFVLGAQPRQPDPVPLAEPHLLTELVAPDPEATQSLGVGALRAAAAMDAGETQVMDVAEVRNAVAAVLPTVPAHVPTRVSWGVKAADPAEAALSLPGPPPGAGASEISMATGLKAVTSVRAVVTGVAS